MYRFRFIVYRTSDTCTSTRPYPSNFPTIPSLSQIPFTNHAVNDGQEVTNVTVAARNRQYFVVARRFHDTNDTTCRRVRQTTGLPNFHPRKASKSQIFKWMVFHCIWCQESVIFVQIDQQKIRFQSDQSPFFALKSGGFPLVLLLAAYVHLYVVQIVYFLDIGFLFYRNGMDFSTAKQARPCINASFEGFRWEKRFKNEAFLHSRRDTTSPSNFGPFQTFSLQKMGRTGSTIFQLQKPVNGQRRVVVFGRKQQF